MEVDHQSPDDRQLLEIFLSKDGEPALGDIKERADYGADSIEMPWAFGPTQMIGQRAHGHLSLLMPNDGSETRHSREKPI